MIALALATAQPTLAQDYIALRNLAAQTQLSSMDARAVTADAPPFEGFETARFLRKGEAFDRSALQPKAVLERNQLVQLSYAKGGLAITTEGRVLERASLGALVQVMNLASRTIVTGRVRSGTVVEVE